MNIDTNRQLAMGGLAALTLAVIATAHIAPDPVPRGADAGHTPRTAKACEPPACLAAGTDRLRTGFGSGSASDADPAPARDPAVRWARDRSAP